jgi:hypothetical protein
MLHAGCSRVSLQTKCAQELRHASRATTALARHLLVRVKSREKTRDSLKRHVGGAVTDEGSSLPSTCSRSWSSLPWIGSRTSSPAGRRTSGTSSFVKRHARQPRRASAPTASFYRALRVLVARAKDTERGATVLSQRWRSVAERGHGCSVASTRESWRTRGNGGGAKYFFFNKKIQPQCFFFVAQIWRALAETYRF